MEKGISYLNRTYADYKAALIEYSKKYFPDFSVNYDDASVASWLLGMNAAVADDLSYHIDRTYQETNLDSAQEKQSLYSLARSNGVKIPGPKGSMAEVRISCTLPVDNMDDYAPIIKKGTKFSSASQQFELLDDVDFSHQFNEDNVSDRTYSPTLDSNGNITGYTVSKLAMVVAGETRVYRRSISLDDVKPFMEIVLPIENVMSIESIIVQKNAANGNASQTSIPPYGVFYQESETCNNGNTVRFFEVDSLVQSERWGETLSDKGRAKKFAYRYSGATEPTYCITKGEWKPVEHKFITEYTDNGYIKIIFGAGNNGGNVSIGEDASDFAKWQISRILNNGALGLLPEGNSVAYILYRVGGGAASNVARGAINRINYLNADFRGSDTSIINIVKRTLTVSNTTPSISVKDMPSEEEMRYLIKYHSAAQERCVTIKDYIDRILLLPPKYGTPFRVGVIEENNKIMVYLLGINDMGKLDTLLPVALVRNIEDYLSHYRMINDYVEIKAGRIINLQFHIDVMIDKNYNKSDVIAEIRRIVEDYMDINKHIMGEEIYTGDIEKEISKVDGVINLMEMRVYNVVGGEYSSTQVSQPTMADDGNITTSGPSSTRVNLDASDGILYSDGDTMMEIKNPSEDIKIWAKER